MAEKKQAFCSVLRVCWIAVSLYTFGFFPAVFAQEPSREEILQYALDTEIIGLIQELTEEDNRDYTEELSELFARTNNNAIRENIFRMFSAQEIPVLEDACLAVLSDPYDSASSLVAAAAGYAGKLKLSSALPALRSMAGSGDYAMASAAVRAIGEAGGPEEASFLLALMDEELFDEEKQRLVFRQDIMQALSRLDVSGVRESLLSIVQDTEENAVIRASAANAVGTLAIEEDVDTLADLFNESDPILRAAAVSSLAHFSSAQAQERILEAFRDSYYRVRLAALTAAENAKLSAAVPYIIYRAKTDPEETVKMRSYEVLGAIGGSEALDFLSGVLQDEKASDKFRAKAAEVLLEGHFDSFYPEVEKVALEAVGDEKKRWLCHELGKTLSGIATGRTSSLAARYLDSRDPLTQSLGLDMYEKNGYPALESVVRELAENPSAGAIQRRAAKILGTGTDTGETPSAAAGSTPAAGTPAGKE